MKVLASKVWAYLLTVLIAVVNISCTESKSIDTKDIAPAMQTFCVALDLSDRIADEQQVANDLIAIKRVFEVFEQRVKDQRYIRSRDKFMVNVIPQTGTNKEVERMAASISIDMASIPIKQKLTEFKEFKKKLLGTLRGIYKTARKPQLSDYSGANIWKYLNDILPEHVKSSSGIFRLLLVSDCYIELDNTQEVFSRGGQTNHMNWSLMDKLREADSWRSSPCDILLLPERLCRQDLSRLDVVLIGLLPKNPYPFETSLLEKVWESLLDRMGVGSYHIIPYEGNDTHLIRKTLTDTLT